LRFVDVDIPQGSEIVDAYIIFATEARSVDATNLRFQGEASDNAERFRNARRDISSRTRTASVVDWSDVPPWFNGNDVHRTPSLKPIVQELVDRPGWQRTSPMVFIITGSGTRVAETYEEDADGSALLRLEFKEP
jgi:type IV pilus assembly protein PilY1